MNHLRTILAALLLAAAPAAAQTIKTLGYNTTNGNVVAARTNLTFTNSLVDFQTIRIQDFEIDASTIKWGEIERINGEELLLLGSWTMHGALGFNNTTNAAITRTNLGGTTTGNAVFTATNAAAAATAIGLGATNNVTFNIVSTIQLEDSGQAKIDVDDMFLVNTNAAGNAAFDWGGPTLSAGLPISFSDATNAAITRTNLGLGATNNVTFSNVTATGTLGVSNAATFSTNVTVNGNVTTSGTLTATGNVTMAGTGNTAPNQTASSGSSLMTRALADARYLGLKSHLMNFATFATRTANSGSSSSFRGAWQLFTATNASSFASAYGEWAYLLGLPLNQRYINFSNPFSISFSYTVQPAGALPRAGLTQFVQLGRDVNTINSTNAKLSQKGVGVQFASNGLTPFVHDGTSLTDGASITNISTYNRFVLRWVPATAFEVYGVANGGEPVLLGSVTNNLPSGNSANESTIEFSQLDSGSGGANAWMHINNGYIITP